jgi:hypothetical protein
MFDLNSEDQIAMFDYYWKACLKFNTAGPRAKAFFKAHDESNKPFSEFDKVAYEQICQEEDMSYGDWMEYAKDLVRPIKTTQGR